MLTRTLRSVAAGLLTTMVPLAQAGEVKIVERDGAYQLLVDGTPFVAKGAGGQDNLDLLRENGGNSIRTWHIDNAGYVLDEAHKRGIMVTMGIWLQHPRHGFDYTNKEAVEAQREMVRNAVLELKDHPALLMWGLGNEVELHVDPAGVFPEIQYIAAMVEELDPDHPQMTVIAGADREKIELFRKTCPSIDLIGVNKYGSVEKVPQMLEDAGYDGPYMITEFGPRGWWESPEAPWGADIEPTSAEKAEMYRFGYTKAVLEQPEKCLGSYVFLWGEKQEATETWFGMFLKDGGRTPVVDVMREMWTGTPPVNRAPVVSGIKSRAALKSVNPGETFEARAIVDDHEDDQLAFEWVIIEESTDRRSGGDAEYAPPRRTELTLNSGRSTGTFRAPMEPGPYRIFVFARDIHGGVGTANIPFHVGSWDD